MRSYRYTILVTGAILALFVFIASWQVGRWTSCRDKGGEYVQGMFGYTCVGEDEP